MSNNDKAAEVLRDQFHDLRKRAETSWQRGFQAGLQSAREKIDGAQSTVHREREDHRRWQAMMTDALAQAEAQTLTDVGLLRQALEALEGMEEWASSIFDGYPPSTASIAAAPYRDVARAAIAALRERLGVSNG